MNRFIGTASVLLALAAPAPLFAQAALRVAPLTLDIVTPAQASSLTLDNRGTDEISLQVRIFEWSQIDGEDQLTPAADVVASPPAVRIPAGGSQTIRVARTGGSAVEGERSYRLWIDELPQAAPPAQSGGRVDVRMRYDLPLFFRDRGAEPQLSWRAYRSGDALVVEAENRG